MKKDRSQVGRGEIPFRKPERGDEIVITGMSGKFPDSHDIYHFRDNLFNKVDMVSDDHRRWTLVHPEISPRGGKLFDIEKFDRGFFGVSHVQSDHMDPILRMILEGVYEALMDAGHNPVDFEKTNTAVSLGLSLSKMNSMSSTTQTNFNDTLLGCLPSTIAGRISYFFKLRGPAFGSDTACSSSAYALDEAYRKLLKGECDKAIVATANLCIHPVVTLQFARLGALSPDGASKSFDNSGNGYVRSEAVVVILLEKAKDAKRIYAEVVNSKTSCDGFKEEGITFPSSGDQIALLEDLYKEVQVDPSTLTFVEAHATGTKAGDPQEANTLDKFFCKERNKPLLVGAVKSNIGHSEPASALCSLVKVLLAMETGFIPPNLHYKEPKQGLEGFIKGRMVVVTEKTPLPDDRGLVGVNNFGFGGANAHILLRWNPKPKVNYGIPADNLPRLICVHGRNEEAVASILNDVKGRALDGEQVYLIHQVFRKQIENNLYRGFGIFTKEGEMKRSLRKADLEQPQLYLVFSNFEKEWLKVGYHLRKLPIFDTTINCIQRILHEVTNIDIYATFKNPAKENVANQILGTVAVQIGLANILKSIRLTPYKIIGIGSGELVAAYLDNYLTLKQAVLGLYCITSSMTSGNNNNWEALKENLPQKRNSHNKWIPLDESKLTQSSATYFLNNVVNSTNEKSIRGLIPKNALAFILGPNIKGVYSNTLSLLNGKSKDPVFDLLNSLGSLFEYGFEMELNKLYPSIQLPVSRGTPMLSPLIKWQHSDCKVFKYESGSDFRNEQNLTSIHIKNDDWNFIVGHVIDGRNLFPATGYLILAWETLALKMGMHLPDMKVVFEDVKFIRAANVPTDGALELMVTIQSNIQTFEITEGDVTIVSGKICQKTEEQVLYDLPAEELDADELQMDEKDIYKELKLRGYHYTEMFKGVKKYSVESSTAIVCWDSNWITFLDCFCQVAIMDIDTRSLFVPTSIGQLIIDAPKHIESCARYNNMIPVKFYKNLNIIKTDGIEVRQMSASAIPRRKWADPVLEISKFIPNEGQRNAADSATIFAQIVWENTNALKMKVVEVCPQEFDEGKLLSPLIQKAFDGLPAVKQDLIVLTNKQLEIPRILVQNKSLREESKCTMLIVTKILESTKISEAISAVEYAKGYIVTREHLDVDLTKFDESPFKVISNQKNTEEMLVLLRPIKKSSAKTSYINLTNTLEDFQWISKLQDQIKNSDKVILFSQNDDINGLLGLSTCLQQEQSSSKIKCVFIMDEAPKFDPDLEFYRKQLDKDMAINVWKDKAWGTYRHLVLPKDQTVETEHTYANVTTRGDLSTLSWLEGSISSDDQQPELEKDLIHIYYSAINFRDLMMASGKLSIDTMLDRMKQECVQGLEFVGRNSKGQRVMGISSNGALASTVMCPKRMLFEIPEKWSMEEASTIVVVYLTVLQALDGCELGPDKSILIHSGTGGVGLAAINLCLYFGLDIFVTVGTPEKRDFLRKHYPQIKEEQIGNSRDTSFEAMVHHCTNGKGVDYVLNSLAKEKLLASVRCLASNGRFLEIGKFDLASNNALALNLLEKNAHFVGVALDRYDLDSSAIHTLCARMTELIKKGAIQPLPRTIFKQSEVEQAFRYMGLGKHIGKVVLKIRDEDDGKIWPLPRTLFKAVPRFICNPTSSYLICGGLGGFGLELADFMVVRGAKNLILTSTSGLSNGYQKYRIRIWESYGVNVLTTTLDASTESGCEELFKIANELAPLDGIFNLAVVLRDGLFENQTEENFKISLISKAYCTKNLDSISRKLCPKLRYFVVFSSISCGRGNTGQTNYGMANSVMERICEKRKREGYPALAIQWGAIGEVGLVAKMQENNKELVIGGTLQQRISSCLQVMDQLLRQNEPIVGSMVVAEKKYGGKADNLFDAVLNVMGISNLKSVSIHSTFPELGMDSMMAVEIKHTLEREYEVFLTPQDLKGMTLSKLGRLGNLTNTQKADVAVSNLGSQVEILEGINLMLHQAGSEDSATEPMMRMKTAVKHSEEAPHIFVLPGIEGMADIFEVLCQDLKAHVTCLQFCPGTKTESITQLATSILPYFEAATDDLIILGYSFGCIVAQELLYMLEAKGKKARVIFVDGSAELLIRATKLYLPHNDENVLQDDILGIIMSRYLPTNVITNHKKHLTTLHSYEEKIKYIISVSPYDFDVSAEFITQSCVAAFEKLYAILKHNVLGGKLKSRVTLFKASSTLLANAAPDYGLSSTFENLEDVIIIEGNHATMLENKELAKEINKMLGGS